MLLFWIGFSVVLGSILGGLVRRFIWKPHRVRIPANFVEELNGFAMEFQRAADSMASLAKKFDQGERGLWKKKSDMILKNLQRMNRLLRQLNRFFEERSDKIEEELRSSKSGTGSAEFTGIEELAKFKKMGSITEKEVKEINWEEIFRKFRQE